MIKVFVLSISVLFTFCLHAQQSDFAGLDNLTASNAKKGVKFYQKQLKKDGSARHEYFLGAAYYLKALANSKKQMEFVQKAEEHLENIKNDASLKFQYNFRMGLCKSFYDDYDAALPYFSNCVSMYPMHIESNCFKAISMAYQLENTDTSDFFQIVDDLNALILINSDTSILENLGKSLLCLKNKIDYPVADEASKLKLNGIVDLSVSIFPIEFIGGMYDLDSSNFTINPLNAYQENGFIYEVKQDSNLISELLRLKLSNKPIINNSPILEECSEFIKKLNSDTDLATLLCLPKGCIIDEYSITTFKNIRLIRSIDGGKIFDHKSLSTIDIKSDQLTQKGLKALHEATYLDRLYFDIDYLDEGVGPKTVSISIGL